VPRAGLSGECNSISRKDWELLVYLRRQVVREVTHFPWAGKGRQDTGPLLSTPGNMPPTASLPIARRLAFVQTHWQRGKFRTFGSTIYNAITWTDARLSGTGSPTQVWDAGNGKHIVTVFPV